MHFGWPRKEWDENHNPCHSSVKKNLIYRTQFWPPPVTLDCPITALTSHGAYIKAITYYNCSTVVIWLHIKQCTQGSRRTMQHLSLLHQLLEGLNGLLNKTTHATHHFIVRLRDSTEFTAAGQRTRGNKSRRSAPSALLPLPSTKIYQNAPMWSFKQCSYLAKLAGLKLRVVRRQNST